MSGGPEVATAVRHFEYREEPGIEVTNTLLVKLGWHNVCGPPTTRKK